MNDSLHEKAAIYHYRKLKGLSQVQMAEKLGIDPVTLWRYENFRSCPRGRVRERIAGLLERTPGQIVDEYGRRSA